MSGTVSLMNPLSFIIKIKSLFGRVLYNQFTSLFKSASQSFIFVSYFSAANEQCKVSVAEARGLSSTGLAGH